MVNNKIKSKNNSIQTKSKEFQNKDLLKETIETIKINTTYAEHSIEPLLNLISDEKLKNLELIVNHKLVPFTQEDIYNSLIYSLKSRHGEDIEIAKFLLNHISEKALMNKIISETKFMEPSLITLHKKDLEFFKKLVKIGVEINESDEYGNTPLHVASEKGMEEVVDFLIKNGAEIHVENDMNKTPYILALEKSHDSVIEIFIEHLNKNNQEELASELKEKLEEGTLSEHNF